MNPALPKNKELNNKSKGRIKIIVSYVSAGEGHRKAAQSLYNYFRENCQNIEIKIIDALQKNNALFKDFYIYSYQFLINHSLRLWQFGFWLTRIKFLKNFNKITLFITYRLNTINFSKFIIEEDADFIISTHFLSSEVCAYLKKTKKIRSKIVTVITDFGVHPFWISDGIDLYVVASNSTKEQLIQAGIKEDKIKEFGIPVEAKFLKEYDRAILCKELGIKENRFTVLIITGSFGIGPIEKIINLLYKDVQILAVCANNRKLYNKLKKKNYQDVKVYAFVDNIQELMSVSDIIVTKPGGLSISEILIKELVPIFISAIPGQETENINILRKYNIGIDPEKIEGIKDIILDYKEHPDKLKNAKEDIKAIKKPFAARELCNAIASEFK